MAVPPPLADAGTRAVAAALLARHRVRPRVSPRAILSRLRAGDSFTGSGIDEVLESFLLAGWIQIASDRKAGGFRAFEIRVLDPRALAEHAEPGGDERRRQARVTARSRLAGIEHPVAEEAMRLLDADEVEGRLSVRVMAALAVVAAHAGTGDVIAARVLSTRDLGDSKALDRARRAVERRLGAFEGLGIREGSAVTLVGGAGCLVLPDVTLDVGTLSPMVGLSRESLQSLQRVECPQGLVVVENLTVFESCCRGEAGLPGGALFAWSGGYPGRGVRALVEAASRAGSRTSCWADIDLDGIRIARLVQRWAGSSFEALRMDEADVLRAPVRRELEPRMRRAIEAELAMRPDAMLAATLRVLLREGVWVEQEGML